MSPCKRWGAIFYDIFPLEENKAAIYIGDSIGHGLKSALVTHLIYPIPQVFAQQKQQLAPTQILRTMDQILYKAGKQRSLPTYATAFYGVFYLNEYSKGLMYAGAGHLFPILHRAGQTSILGNPGRQHLFCR